MIVLIFIHVGADSNYVFTLPWHSKNQWVETDPLLLHTLKSAWLHWLRFLSLFLRNKFLLFWIQPTVYSGTTLKHFFYSHFAQLEPAKQSQAARGKLSNLLSRKVNWGSWTTENKSSTSKTANKKKMGQNTKPNMLTQSRQQWANKTRKQSNEDAQIMWQIDRVTGTHGLKYKTQVTLMRAGQTAVVVGKEWREEL